MTMEEATGIAGIVAIAKDLGEEVVEPDEDEADEAVFNEQVEAKEEVEAANKAINDLGAALACLAFKPFNPAALEIVRDADVEQLAAIIECTIEGDFDDERRLVMAVLANLGVQPGVPYWDDRTNTQEAIAMDVASKIKAAA